jgi:hypothetical protein
MAENLTEIRELIARKYGILDVSHYHMPPLPVTRIILIFSLLVT